MEYVNKVQFEDVGLIKVEHPEGDVTNNFFKLDFSQVVRVHPATFVDEAGKDLPGLWVVTKGISHHPVVLKTLKHPVDQSESYTHGMDISSVSGIDAVTITLNDVDYFMYPQVHAIQYPTVDDQVLTTYLLMGYVLIPTGVSIESLGSHLAKLANLQSVDLGEGTVVWAHNDEAARFNEYGGFVSDPAKVMTKHYEEHNLLEMLDGPMDVSED